MPRVMLLCFIHGFKGNDDTFHEFPDDLKRMVAKQLPDNHVESVVYPKYETKGELDQATAAFLEWLKERVMDLRKVHCDTPWPPNDDTVGVILVAHSMGGFVAADTLFLTLNERATNPNGNDILFPNIKGILTFDTPFNGLARSMFVYGAFSNYSKVSNVWNAMTALSAAAPAALSRMGTQRAAATSVTASSRSPKWQAWQLLAIRTGTVGAIAAGGVAAYIHRESIMKGVQNVRNMNMESVTKGYHQTVESLGQGLAYINRGNVGKSFAWLSDHFTFVGALLKQKELSRRLDRMGALRGVGLRDFYVSMGANGYWSGGYFVPERTFCAVPEEEHAANRMFVRRVMGQGEDEIQAHMNLFRPEKHKGYEDMVDESAGLLREWFCSDAAVFDDPSFQTESSDEAAENKAVDQAVDQTLESAADEEGEADEGEAKAAEDDVDELPDESPIDIAAAASLVPENETDPMDDAAGSTTEEQKRTYFQYLTEVAQRAGTGAKGWLPDKVPAMPKVPASVSSLGQASMPSLNVFSSQKGAAASGEGEKKAETEGNKENVETAN